MNIQSEPWVERAGEADQFYRAAFGASVLHSMGDDDDDSVAQLAIGDAAFWVAPVNPELGRFSPEAARAGTRSSTMTRCPC